MAAVGCGPKSQLDSVEDEPLGRQQVPALEVWDVGTQSKGQKAKGKSAETQTFIDQQNPADVTHLQGKCHPGWSRADHRAHDWRTADTVHAVMSERANKDHNETGWSGCPLSKDLFPPGSLTFKGDELLLWF